MSLTGNIWQWSDSAGFRANDLKYRYMRAVYHGTDKVILWLDDSVDLSKQQYVDFLRHTVDGYEKAVYQSGIETVNAAMIKEDMEAERQKKKRKKK